MEKLLHRLDRDLVPIRTDKHGAILVAPEELRDHPADGIDQLDAATITNDIGSPLAF